VEFVRLAYRLGREAATGRLRVTTAGARATTHELYLRRGYLTYADVAAARVGQILVESGVTDRAAVERTLAGRGPRLAGQALRAAGTITDAALDAALRRQAELRLGHLAAVTASSGAAGGARFHFEPNAPAPPAHRTGRPVALAAWARSFVDARFDLAAARALARSLEGKRLVLRKDLAPDPADDAERTLLGALATPRTLTELAGRVPERRLLVFLHFLATLDLLVGAGVLVGVRILGAPEPAHDLLGVAAGSDVATLKQAYRRRVRQLHPDLHPGASADARRALEAELSAVNEAYRQLVKIG
jgi:hypothetical protein